MNDVPKDEMSPIERMTPFAAGKPYDRIPCSSFSGKTACHFIGTTVSKYRHSAKLMAEVEIVSYKMFGHDGAGAGPGFLALPEMLSQIIALFEQKDIADRCSLTMPIVVVDTLDYLDMVDDFGLFFKDQITYGEIIVLSKIQLMMEDNLEVIIKSLRTINPRADIVARDWRQFSELDFWELTYTRFFPENAVKPRVATATLPGNLQSYSIIAPKQIDRENLQNILDNLLNKRLGRIVRAKGFVEGDDGSLEFSYFNGRYIINKNSLGNSSRVCIIGRNLNQYMLSSIWS